MTKRYCPTCNGKGTINNPKYRGKPMMYLDLDGNAIPQIPCPNCNGSGFVGSPDK